MCLLLETKSGEEKKCSQKPGDGCKVDFINGENGDYYIDSQLPCFFSRLLVANQYTHMRSVQSPCYHHFGRLSGMFRVLRLNTAGQFAYPIQFEPALIGR